MSERITIQSHTRGTVELYPSDIYVEMTTGLGIVLIDGVMPKAMEEGLKKCYFESGAVKGYYLYVDGKEITDNLNHNPFHGMA
jgi:hypothetical protein